MRSVENASSEKALSLSSPCPGSRPPIWKRSTHVHNQAAFANALPLLFGVSAVITVVLAVIVRLTFRRGKDITQL